MSSWRAIAVLTVSALLGAGASLAGSPRFPGESWQQYATPEEAGWSTTRLDAARRYMEEIGSAAVLVVHDGAVVASWGEVERRFPIHSIAATLLSSLYGIQVDAGSIDPEATLAALEIDDVDPELDARHKQASILDLLTGSSGIPHAAVDETPRMKLQRTRYQASPGRVPYVGAWDRNALLTIFEQATGASMFDELAARIAAPIGMQDFRARDGDYLYIAPVSVHPAYPLRMSARDLARFGHLVLHGGAWSGRQIVPEAWIAESTRAHRRAPDGTGFGYQWTVATNPRLASYGHVAARTAGHSVDVLPVLGLVVVQRSDTFRGHVVGERERVTLLQRIIAARTGEAQKRPELVELPETAPGFEPAQLDTAALKRLAGTYSFPFGVEIRITIQNGGLVADMEKGRFDLLPLSETEFVVADREERLFFRSPGAGRRLELVTEDLLRRQAYFHVWNNDLDSALELMRRNSEYFPHSYRAHDALGEIYALVGDLQLAFASYKRSLILNPDNANASRMLRLIHDDKIALNDLRF
jgi:CubicO group peptidase (beta-lactamase class C family)